jgi:hypothetical protein
VATIRTQAGDPAYQGGEAGSPEMTPLALVRHGAAADLRSRAPASYSPNIDCTALAE